MYNHPAYIGPHALTLPFDPDNDPDCILTSETTQEAIEELCGYIAISASPGFTWGRSGNVPAGSWLLNDTVPSNLTGRNIFLYNGQIEMVYTSNEITSTYDLSIYEHDGTTYTLLTTISLISGKSIENYLATPISITNGKELAAKIETGSAKNVTAGLLLRGTLIP